MSSTESDSEPDLPGISRPAVELPVRRRRLSSSSSEEVVKPALASTARPKASLPSLGVVRAAVQAPAKQPPKSAPRKSTERNLQASPPAASPILKSEEQASPVAKARSPPSQPTLNPVATALDDSTSDIEYHEADTENEESTAAAPQASAADSAHIATPVSTSGVAPASNAAILKSPRPATPPRVVAAPAAVEQTEDSRPKADTAPLRPPPKPPASPSPVAPAERVSRIEHSPQVLAADSTNLIDEDEEALLSKALMRIEKRSSRQNSRAGTPVRQSSMPRGASVGTGRAVEVQAPAVPVPVPSTHQLAFLESARERLLRENVRLNDELTWLTKEHEKHRGASEKLVLLERGAAARDEELSAARKHLDEASRENARFRSSLEGKLRSLSEHAAQLESELETSRATVAQFEGRLNEKDRAIASEATISTALRAELRDLAHEMKRVRDDAARQHDEDQARIDQISTVLAEAKKQRVVLLDLNDKFSREKEMAEAEKRRAQDDLRAFQQTADAAKAKQDRDVTTLRREVEAARDHGLEREKTLTQEITQLRASGDRLQEQLTLTLARLDESEAKHHALIKDSEAHHEQRVRDLQARLDQSDQRVTRLQAQLDEAEAKYSTATKLREEASAEGRRIASKEAQAELQFTQRRLRDVETELASVRDQNSSLVTQLEHELGLRLAADEVATKSKARLSSVREAMDKLLASDDQLSEENERLHRRISEFELAMDRLEGEARGASLHAAHADELQTENERLTASLLRVSQERDELSREIEKLHNEIRTSFRMGDLSGAGKHTSNPRSSRDFVF